MHERFFFSLIRSSSCGQWCCGWSNLRRSIQHYASRFSKSPSLFNQPNAFSFSSSPAKMLKINYWAFEISLLIRIMIGRNVSKRYVDNLATLSLDWCVFLCSWNGYARSSSAVAINTKNFFELFVSSIYPWSPLWKIFVHKSSEKHASHWPFLRFDWPIVSNARPKGWFQPWWIWSRIVRKWSPPVEPSDYAISSATHVPVNWSHWS